MGYMTKKHATCVNKKRGRPNSNTLWETNIAMENHNF